MRSPSAGYPDVEPILQGSAVTGKNFGTGAPFDVGRVSDFDVALAKPSQTANRAVATKPFATEIVGGCGLNLVDISSFLDCRCLFPIVNGACIFCVNKAFYERGNDETSYFTGSSGAGFGFCLHGASGAFKY